MSGSRITAIIFGALMMGVASFAVVVAVLVSTGTVVMSTGPTAPPDGASGLAAGLGPVQMMAIIASLAVLSAVPVAFALRARILARSATPATARWQQAHIVAGAILEGAGLLCCVFALVTGHLAFLAGAGLMVIAMAALFPTPARADLWAAEVADLSP
jgi:hypothetical protein